MRGDWLLTLSYDNDRQRDGQFREQIDPTRFYTLYGDGTEQFYDGETERALYLKLEREAFTALLGDLDTHLDRTELTRYSRQLNGAQLEYHDDVIKATAFAANTDQGFFLDTIAGDGTSGIYRLRRGGLVRNGERVAIVVRDRFNTDVEISRTALSRFLDYSIDYDAGTLIFKRPIAGTDQGFNPQFIEVAYEVDGRQSELVAGGRVAYSPVADGGENEAGVTYVQDDAAGNGGELYGADLDWQLGEQNRVRLEAARSDTAEAGSGEAYLAEISRETGRLAARAYFRQQDAAFGLGQQTLLDSGLRRYGVDGEWRPNDRVRVRAEAGHQEDLRSGGERDLVALEGSYRHRGTDFRGGLRSVRETPAAGDERTTHQATAGISQTLAGGRLLVRADGELGLDSGADAADFPDRVLAGIEYRLPRGFSLFAEQELTWQSERDTQGSRLGLKGQPWVGADVHSSIDRQITENGARLFATTGLLQQWRFGDYWLLDAGFDRVKTLNESAGALQDPAGLTFAPELPAASGSFGNGLSRSPLGLTLNNDYTAAFFGAGYRRDQWDASARLEHHDGDQSEKTNLLLGMARQLSAGRIYSLSASLLDEDGVQGVERRLAEARLGFAWRPLQSRWSVLGRLDAALDELKSPDLDTRTARLVHNLNLNYKTPENWEWTLHAGLKYVRDRFDSEHFDQLTGVLGVRGRYDLSRRWSLSGQASGLFSGLAGDASRTGQLSAGVAVSRSLMRNMWVRLGYNFRGFQDDDFVAADYTRHGFYLQFRMKVDQHSARRFLARLPGLGGSPIASY